MRRPVAIRHRIGAILSGALLAYSAVPAQEPPTFTETAEVTAFDLVVGVEGGLLIAASTRRGAALDVAELALSVDAQVVPIDTIHPGTPLDGTLEGDHAWTVLVWLAADLASDYQLRWAAAVLSQLTNELTRLGEVEVVLADPEPRTLLAPTRDADAIESALSRLAVAASGEDRLNALRHDWVVERTVPTLELEPGALARAVAAEEEHIVLAHQDELLLALDARREARRRRLLLLVSGGFDPLGQSPDDSPELDPPSVDTTGADETESWLRSIAAYGWIVAPVLAPERDHPLRGGLTVGKLRLHWGGPANLLGFDGAYEEDRDPKRAAAHVALGRSLRDQGRLEEAEKAFRKAVFHYYDDEKTAVAQGIAWLELGDTLSRLGNGSEAHLAWQLAAARLCPAEEDDRPAQEKGRPGRKKGEDPHPGTPCTAVEIAERIPDTELLRTSRLDGEPVLRRLAEITSGVVLGDPESLATGVRDLAERPRITFQVASPAPGRLLAVELASPRYPNLVLRHPAWLRSGTPERLAAARLRHLLARGPLDGDHGLLVHAVGRARASIVELPLSLQPAELLVAAAYRSSWAWLDGDDVQVRHELRVVVPEDGAWRLPGPSLPAATAAVMVEDLSQGRWGAAILELER
jgi:tetratricopeptide (TPR) repeat protein